MFTKRQRQILFTLLIASVVFCLLGAAIQDGYENPIQTRDSKGNPLGFNNPITFELYGILLKSASFSGIINKLGWYGLFYFSLHVVVLIFLLKDSKPKAWRALGTCFLLQPFLFPYGIFGLLLMPFYVLFFAFGTIDGESITDFNFPFWYIFQALWIAPSIFIGIATWKNGLRKDKLQKLASSSGL